MEKYFELLEKTIRDFDIPIENIYNMDETGLCYQKPPAKGLATQKMSGVKDDKTWITLAFTVNADGSDIRDPLIIGRAHRPHCFGRNNGTALGFDYH